MINKLKIFILIVTLSFYMISCDAGMNSARFSIVPNKDSITIANGGEIALKTIYKDISGNVVEKVKGDMISLTFKLADKDSTIVDLTSGGLVIAKQPGRATVIATLTDKTKSYTDKIEINVKIVDTRKIFLNPSIVTFEKEQSSKTLEVIGVDKTGFPTKLYADEVSYLISNPGMINFREDFNDDYSRLTIQTKTDKVDYTFITPQLKYDANIIITGNPALIQIYPTPQPNKPRPTSSGGDFVSFVNNYNSDNKRVLNIAHSDGHEKIYFHKFDSSSGIWADQTLSLPSGAFGVSGLQLLYINDIYYIVATVDNIIVIFASKNGSSWDDISIKRKNNIKDAYIYETDNKIHVAFVDEIDKSLNITTINGSNHQNIVLVQGIDIKSYFITVNNNNDFRGVLHSDNKLLYITKQSGSYYKQEIRDENSVKNLKLVFDRKNNPNVIYSSDSSESSIVILSQGGVFGGWKKASITSENFSRAGLKDDYSSSFTIDAISAIDAHYDNKNILRLVVSEDKSIYYIKQIAISSDGTTGFRVDRIATNVGAKYLSTDIDKKDRLIVTYQYDKNDWVRFWAEPILFDYRDEAEIVKTTSDEAEENSQNLLSSISE